MRRWRFCEAVQPLLEELTEKMQSEAAAMDFEGAARTRDLISCLKAMAEPTRRFINQTIARRNASSNPEGVAALQEAVWVCHRRRC